MRVGSLTILAVALACPVAAATFGKVVVIGGRASDLALDNQRGRRYIANFAGRRIDVRSTSGNTLGEPIPLTTVGEASSIALPPDSRYLVAASYELYDQPNSRRTTRSTGSGGGQPDRRFHQPDSPRRYTYDLRYRPGLNLAASVSGAAAPSGLTETVLAVPTFMLADAQLHVEFAGLVPGFVGLYQIKRRRSAQNIQWGASPLDDRSKLFDHFLGTGGQSIDTLGVE